MGYIEGKIEINQYSFLPNCFDNLISEDNPVRLIDSFVNSLDMEKLNFKNAIPKKMGRPSYKPQIMLKLYLYGYFNGIRSSRKLERECSRNIELFWLLNELKPDFKTIADFRKDNIKSMENVFTSFSEVCEKLNLIGKEIVAIDGSKFRACNAKKKNYTKSKIKKQIEYYKENVEKYIELLDTMDSKEEDTGKIKASKEEIAKTIEESKKRIYELEKLQEEVEKNGEKSITDPDAKNMKMNNNGIDICHNTQIAVDRKNHIVVAVDVTSSPADQNQLYNMSKKAKEALKVEKITTLADKGYWNGEELKKCKEEQITTIVSSPKQAGKKGYRKSEFKYDKEKDVYICPQGETLCKSKGKELTYKNSKACKNCPQRDKCTKSKRGRKILRNKNEEILEENIIRQKEQMAQYKERQKIVEHVFGTIKRAFGYTHFLLKKNEKVRGESFMHFLIYNMKRAIKIINIKEIIMAIEQKQYQYLIKKYKYWYCLTLSSIMGSFP